MWLAMVFFCTTSDVMSCKSYANTDELYMTERGCIINVMETSAYIISEYSPKHLRPACIKLGEAA